MDDRVAFGRDWLLWRDFAVRSAGFPVGGLGVFGPGDEPVRLREAALDPAFREAMTWQNPAAVANALDKLADAPGTSKGRRREEVVAAYWQRYCAKNDTIGFYGPLAWGRIEDDGPRLAVRSGALVRERGVQLESWGVQALAAALDPALRVPLGPRSEEDLRALLATHPDAAVRERGTAALARLETARDRLAAAPRQELVPALAALDAAFTELTGRAPSRNHGRAYGARTLAYPDCLRDLDVALGPAFLADVAPAVTAVFEAGRWFSGRIQAIGEQVAAETAPPGRVPFGAVAGPLLGRMMALPPAIADEVAELRRRFGALLADPEPATLAARAAAAFADYRPAWPHAGNQSVDLQLVARDAEAIAAGDYLAVVGDMHPGDNPLAQALFGLRHPDPARFARMVREDAGRPCALLLPPWGPGIQADARGMPLYPEDTTYVALFDEACAPHGARTWRPDELWVRDGDVVDARGELRVALAEVFALPIFVMAVRTFGLWPESAHDERLTLGRVVLRRETWHVPAADVPDDLAALGLPRRVFVKTPAERKPFLVDLESPVLGRIARRHIRAAAAARAAEPVRFTEMLPGPEDCWLAGPDGGRYAAELRLVGVNRRPGGSAGSPPGSPRAA